MYTKNRINKLQKEMICLGLFGGFVFLDISYVTYQSMDLEKHSICNYLYFNLQSGAWWRYCGMAAVLSLLIVGVAIANTKNQPSNKTLIKIYACLSVLSLAVVLLNSIFALYCFIAVFLLVLYHSYLSCKDR